MKIEPSELQWNAFRYVAGEMSADESQAFEQQLELDTAACEAVAEAVHLSDLALMAHSDRRTTVGPAKSGVTLATRTRSWPRRLLWMSCGAAAAVLLLVIAQPFRSSMFHTQSRLPSGETGFTSGGTASSELALAWAATRDDLRPSVDEVVETSEPIIAEEGVEDSELAAPSWMLTAVVGLAGDAQE